MLIHTLGTRRIVGVSLLALSLLVAALVAGVLQVRASGPLELNGDSVIHYEERYALLDSHRVIVDGIRQTDGRCTFTSPELTVSEPGETLQVDELAYDPETCRSLVSIGHPVDAPQEGGSPEDGYEHDESERMGPGAPVDIVSADAPFGLLSDVGQPAFAYTSHHGWHKSWFEDPAYWVGMSIRSRTRSGGMKTGAVHTPVLAARCSIGLVLRAGTGSRMIRP